jgi:L-iditol 2-dehydrogenase
LKALRYYGPSDLRLEDVPRPEPGPGDVLVEIDVALTDGTDLKTFRRGHPRILDGLPAPFGHEFCGVDVATGRRVVAANSAPCRHCDACQAGRETLCRRLEFLAGAYAEYLLVPESIAAVNLHPVPDHLPSQVAALVEPLACCLHGIDQAAVRPGAVVAVLGTGPIGLMLCACVADAGGYPVTVGGRPERHRLAPAFGARPGDPRDAEVVIEAAGTPQAWRDALELVRPGGTVVFFGGLDAGIELPVDAFRLHYEELTLRGSFHHTPRHVRAALAFLASGAYPWEQLITHEVRLDGVAGLMSDPPPDYLKAAVRPG